MEDVRARRGSRESRQQGGGGCSCDPVTRRVLSGEQGADCPAVTLCPVLKDTPTHGPTSHCASHMAGARSHCARRCSACWARPVSSMWQGQATQASPRGWARSRLKRGAQGQAAGPPPPRLCSLGPALLTRPRPSDRPRPRNRPCPLRLHQGIDPAPYAPPQNFFPGRFSLPVGLGLTGPLPLPKDIQAQKKGGPALARRGQRPELCLPAHPPLIAACPAVIEVQLICEM